VKAEHDKIHGQDKAGKEAWKAEAARLAKSAEMDAWMAEELGTGKDKDEGNTSNSDPSVVAPQSLLTEVSELSVEDGSTAQALDPGRHDAKTSSLSAVVKESILGQSSDPTSTPTGQCASSSESRHEQAADVDSDHLDQEDVDLEDDAAFAMVSKATRGAKHAPVEQGRRLTRKAKLTGLTDVAPSTAEESGTGKEKKTRSADGPSSDADSVSVTDWKLVTY
jgi:hypothetical protein